MAQLNDLIVLGNTSLIGPIKANSDHDLLAHTNEFNFASPKFSGDIYVNYRTASGSDGTISSYRFCKGGGGSGYADIYASTFYGSLSGNATSSTTATKFSSARTIALTGDVSGSASADGSSGWSISTTVADNSHNHGYLSGWADTRSAATAPNDYNGQFKVVGIKQKSLMDIDGSAYSSLIGFRGWSDSSGGNSHELAFTGNGNLYHRHGATTSWGSWNRIPMCGTDNTFSGTNTFSGQVILSRTTDADGTTDTGPALRIGAISGSHLEFDGNEIMAKASGTTTGPLYLNNNGGLVQIGSGGLQVGGTISSTVGFQMKRTNGDGYGLGLYGTSAHNTYGIHMSKTATYGTHGPVTSDWATYFCFDGADTRGWIFKHAGTNVASISGSGGAKFDNTVFGYAYTRSNNKAAFMWDKPGGNYTGVGANGTTDTIYFSACDINGAWITSYKQKWVFNGSVTADTVAGAIWNDYAEYRKQKENIKPGYCVISTDNGEIYKTTEKFQVCDGIVSDTFGFSIGETNECKTPLAVAGRVLAYCYGDKNDYHSGDIVCAGPEGKVYKMTREEIKEYPDRIIGHVSEIPNYEYWGTGNVKVDNRIWIKVK